MAIEDYKLYLIRPDKTTATVNITKTGKNWSAITDMEVFELEFESMAFSINIDNKINEPTAQQRRTARPNRYVTHSYVFQGIVFADLLDNSETQKSLKALQYLVVEWPKLSVSLYASILGLYNSNTSTWADYFHIYRSGFTNCKVMIDMVQGSMNRNLEFEIDKLSVQEVWGNA